MIFLLPGHDEIYNAKVTRQPFSSDETLRRPAAAEEEEEASAPLCSI